MVSESPMASGPDPPNPDLRESQVANTVYTSMKVMNSSMPKICPLVTAALDGLGVPSWMFVLPAESPLRTPAPTSAPITWTTTYSTALRQNTNTHITSLVAIAMDN